MFENEPANEDFEGFHVTNENMIPTSLLMPKDYVRRGQYLRNAEH
jgi:hypothetical protein